MRGLRWVLVGLAILLVAARLFTGVVYEFDDPTVYLVMKRAPGWTVVQTNTAQAPVRARFVVLDGDENELVYQSVYEGLMRAAVPLAVGACGLAWLMGRRRRV